MKNFYKTQLNFITKLLLSKYWSTSNQKPLKFQENSVIRLNFQISI